MTTLHKEALGVTPTLSLDALKLILARFGAKPIQLLHAFRVFLADHKSELTHLAQRGPENPKLEMLNQILQEQFRNSSSPRGIIFTRTRQSAHSLLLWLQQLPGLQTMDIRANVLIGAGNQTTHMTQVWTLERGWRQGSLPGGERKEETGSWTE